jgi:hypothetical protein
MWRFDDRVCYFWQNYEIFLAIVYARMTLRPFRPRIHGRRYKEPQTDHKSSYNSTQYRRQVVNALSYSEGHGFKFRLS